MSLINGKPLIAHVIDQCKAALSNGLVIVCTSVEVSDDPIYEYCKLHNVLVYRGPLNDVYRRYLGCIEQFGLTVFGRICCDSPGISSALIKAAIETYESIEKVDLVTNVLERTFPIGQSIEIVNCSVFQSQKFSLSHGFSVEHVTQSFYKDSDKFCIYNIKNMNPDRGVSWAVDEPADIIRVSNMLDAGYFFNKEKISIEPRGYLID